MRVRTIKPHSGVENGFRKHYPIGTELAVTDAQFKAFRDKFELVSEEVDKQPPLVKSEPERAETEYSEIETLRQQCRDKGIEIDGRWGIRRLREELDAQ